MSDELKPRLRYWLWLTWAAYFVLPWMFGVLDMSQWDCTPFWALRHFLASLGYWAIGAALYLMTAKANTVAEVRASRAAGAFASLAGISAFLAQHSVYMCP